MATRGFYGADSGGSGSVGTTNYAQVSPLNDPNFAQLFGQTQSLIPQSLPGIDQLIAQGMNSPLLQLVLGPALQRLQAPQAQQRQNLTEATRAAGGLRGSTYGQDMNTLQNNQAMQTNDLMAQVIQQVLGTLVSGQLQSQQNSFLPGKSYTDLLRAIGPSTVMGSNQVSGGGGVFGSSSMGEPAGTGVSAADRDAQLRGYTNAEAMRYAQILGGMQVRAPSSNTFTTNQPAAQPYTPYLDPLGGGSGGGSYNLGGGTQYNYSSAPTAFDYTGMSPTDVVAQQMKTALPEYVESGGWW